MKKKEYQVPETETIVLVQDKCFMIVTGSNTGEDATIDSEYDPW
jgi:hypothetical protein